MNTQIKESEIKDHSVVPREEWYAASAQLLVKEKELSRMRDEVARQRRALPWTKVEEDYVFHGPDGDVKLSELFDGKSQLLIYHAMWGPDDDEACWGCSIVMDHIDAARLRFQHHDIAFAAVSRGPLSHFAEFKQRMGWKFRWLSSDGNTFNYDFNVSFRREDLDGGDVMYNFKNQKLRSEEQPGLSAFYKNDKGEIFRTYSTYERGLDLLIGAYNFIDLTAKGRNEASAMDWIPANWLELHDQDKG
ncbi:MAG TPA: thioredoxin family protein [Fimbriimonadaceae bacterium]|nr:thioredoxin family protein [Fimbriimonadaceae bacterium]